MNKQNKFLPTNDKRSWYRTIYLKSEHWKNLKKEKFQNNPVCEDCGGKKQLDCHHINYKNIFDVLLTDLKTLCRKCHVKEYKKIELLEKQKIIDRKYSNRLTRQEIIDILNKKIARYQDALINPLKHSGSFKENKKQLEIHKQRLLKIQGE